jgi:two-component system, sensor histidine kinase and response regulator
MNAIIGMAHLALGTELTARQRRYLGSIETAGRHLLGLTNDILDLAKLDANKLTVTPVEFETEALLSHAVLLVAERAADKGLELWVEQACDVPPELVGDPARIGHILTSFLSNAVKFTEQGDVVLRVRREPGRGGAGDWLHLSVQDTGNGISQEQQARLLAPIEQIEASITRRHGGFGLGLIIARRIAYLMQGEVGIDSEIGQGSTFWLRMPLVAASTPGIEAAAPLPELVGRRVLVVDDHAGAREVVCSALERAGCQVQGAESGEAALAEVDRAAREGRSWEAVLVDERMPGLDGLSVARQMLHHWPNLRVALLSPCPGPAPLEAARSAGIAEVLTKPVLVGALREAVQALLLTADEPAGPRRLPSRRGTDPHALRGASVLLVEDNDLNRELATELLEGMGLIVDVACDGVQALQKVREQDYDGVLMDMQMPHIDGLTATREIRRMPGMDALPIIALTANALPGDRDLCLAAGMDDYLAKPVDPLALRETLARWIAPRPRRLTDETAASSGGAGAPSGVAVRVPDWNLPGIDVALGLGRSLGDIDLFVSMLGMFTSGERDFSQRLRALLLARDWAQAERMAHDLKGATAWIGATALRDQVAELEQLLRERASLERIEVSESEVAGQLKTLIDGIAAGLPTSAREAAAGVPAT